MNKKLRIDQDNDRLSSLADELIHRILCFLDTRVAVQTSILSNRWKFIWTTLPSLKFKQYNSSVSKSKIKSGISHCINHVLSRRNHESPVFKLKLKVPKKIPETEKVIKYAISHNVKELHIILNHYHPTYKLKLTTFSSNSIEKLKLRVPLKQSYVGSDCWDLPALTTLHLIYPVCVDLYTLPVSCLICLPALTTLHLDGCKGYNILEWSVPFCLPGLKTLHLTSFNFLESPVSFSLPGLKTLYLNGCSFYASLVSFLGLKTLHLTRCDLRERFWELPDLISLQLEDNVFPDNMSEFFFTLASLQNLRISFGMNYVKDLLVWCPQLVNLQTSTRFLSFPGNIMVLAPNLCNFSSAGIFPITFGGCDLETVNMKLWNCAGTYKGYEELVQQCKRLISIFPVVGSAKILTLDSCTVEALSVVSDLLAHFPSPFYNLKYVKLPQGYEESSLSSTTKSYLIGGSPRATIVTTLPQNDVNAHTSPVSLTAQNVDFQEPFATATKELVDAQDIHKTELVDILDTRVQEENVVEYFGVDAGRARQAGALMQGHGEIAMVAPVTGSGNEQASSYGANRNYGLWQGYEVNPEFVDLLDLIVKKYPETFELLTSKNKKLCTMKLNMLCTLVNDFTKISMTEVDSEMIGEYREHFADLQRSFNINWLLTRLNYIDHLQFSQPLVHELHVIDTGIDDAKNKLQDLETCTDDAKTNLQNLQTHIDDIKSKLHALQTLRWEKITEIQKAFGDMGVTLADSACCIGVDLLSGP